MGQVLAAVDIGSNTVHLLVADAQNGRLKRLRNESEWLGLGAEVTRLGKLSPESVANLKSVLNRFRTLAQGDKATGMYVFATEAMRSAENGAAALKEIGRETKLKLLPISGLQEAALGLRGALIDTRPAKPFVLAEIGGGSAQIAHHTEAGPGKELSIPIGTGRLSALFEVAFPCAVGKLHQVEKHVHEQLQPVCEIGAIKSIVASGGVARGLIRALHPDGERHVHAEELDYLIWAARRMSVEQTARRFNVKLKRASTLMLGAVAFREVLLCFKRNEMTVSEFGVREGAILEMVEGKIQPCPL